MKESENVDESKLLKTDVFSDGLGDCCDCGSLLSFRGRDSAAVVPISRNKNYGNFQKIKQGRRDRR